MSKTNGELLETLEKLQKRYPNWRFGQLIANVAAWAGKDTLAHMAEVTDKALLRAAKEHLQQLHKNRSKMRGGDEALAALRKIRRNSVATGTNKLTQKQIEAEIRQARREQR